MVFLAHAGQPVGQVVDLLLQARRSVTLCVAVRTPRSQLVLRPTDMSRS